MRNAFSAFAVAVSATLAIASPAGLDSDYLRQNQGIGRRGEHIETSNLIIPRHAQRRGIGLPPTADGGNGTGDKIDDYTFKVPGTRTTLVVYLSGVVSARAEMSILNGTNNFLAKQIAASGDGQLPQYVDPFIYDLEQGIFVRCNSTEGQHLTWGILSGTMGWLNLHLSGFARYRYGAVFHMWDDPWGHVGTGEIRPGYTGATVPQIVAGAEGVTHY